MNTLRLVAIAAVVPVCLAASSAGSVRASAEADASPPTDHEATAIGREAYLYAYPMVLQDVTRQQMTNAAAPQFPLAPANQFANARSVPSMDMKAVVRPNVDTLYSTAWLDLGTEPVVLSVPATDADDAVVHKVQDQFKITPLSARGRPVGAPAAGRVDPAGTQTARSISPFRRILRARTARPTGCPSARPRSP